MRSALPLSFPTPMYPRVKPWPFGTTGIAAFVASGSAKNARALASVALSTALEIPWPVTALDDLGADSYIATDCKKSTRRTGEVTAAKLLERLCECVAAVVIKRHGRNRLRARHARGARDRRGAACAALAAPKQRTLELSGDREHAGVMVGNRA